MKAPYDRNRYPLITIYDNVRMQALLLDSLGIEDIALVWFSLASWPAGSQKLASEAAGQPANRVAYLRLISPLGVCLALLLPTFVFADLRVFHGGKAGLAVGACSRVP